MAVGAETRAAVEGTTAAAAPTVAEAAVSVVEEDQSARAPSLTYTQSTMRPQAVARRAAPPGGLAQSRDHGPRPPPQRLPMDR